MIRLKSAERTDKNRLWNIFQKYLYEMSAYYDMEMDFSGNYEYRYFDTYFEENGRAAYFVFDGNTLIGFVMINDYSCINDKIDYSIAEFTIFPKYRRKHCAEVAMRQIFREHQGKWEIKFSNQNLSARAFWLKVTKRYTPQVSPIGEAETVLSFIVK